MGPRVIYWFRTDLRLHDLPALKAALDLNPECFYPIWTWDPHYVYRARVGSNRWQFLLDCQRDLSASITKLNKKSKLFLIREAPETLLPKLFQAWKISHLVFEKDVDGYARERDLRVIELARAADVEVVTAAGRTLWDSDQLVKANGGKPTMSITQVQRVGTIDSSYFSIELTSNQAAKKLGDPPRPIPCPTSLPDPGDVALDFDQEKPHDSPDFNTDQRKKPDQSYKKLAGPKSDFAVPTMDELGLHPAATPHRGGEKNALEILDNIIADADYTATFEKPATAPTAFNPQSTTLLSPHLHFGSLSCREFYWRVQDTSASYKRGSASKPPTSLTGQLIFRDMYFGAQASLGVKFGQTYGNPQARFIPWHLPSEIDKDSGLAKREYEIDNSEAHTWLLRWKYGRTGFPWIDAAMRQLRQEGWIHHLARHAVACFLTRGGCYVDWERGAEVFEEWLIDHEPACNAGNWQWLSCTAFYSQFHRCYSPTVFPQKWDKQGAYVRHYVPELGMYDAKYIYEPWRAPIADQKKWGCIVRGDGGAASGKLDKPLGKEAGKEIYPKPMLDFAERRETCIGAIKQAYRVGLRGSDARVLDGSWRELFDDKADVSTREVEPARIVSEDDKEEDDPLGGGLEDGGQRKRTEIAKTKVKRKRQVSRGQGTLDAHVKKSKK